MTSPVSHSQAVQSAIQGEEFIDDDLDSQTLGNARPENPLPTLLWVPPPGRHWPAEGEDEAQADGGAVSPLSDGGMTGASIGARGHVAPERPVQPPQGTRTSDQGKASWSLEAMTV